MIEDTGSHCESCGAPIADAEPSHYHGDGVTTCIKCAPTFADLLELTKERIEGDDDDPEQTASVAYWIASHLARGGNLSDKALTSPEGQIAPPTPAPQPPGEEGLAAISHEDVCRILDSLPRTASGFDYVRAGFAEALRLSPSADLVAAAKRVLTKLESETESVDIFDQEALAAALRSAGGE